MADKGRGSRDDYEDARPRGRDARERESTKAGGFDWSAVEDDSSADEGLRRRRRTPEADTTADPGLTPRRVSRTSVTLMDLATPVFACAALLPREGGSNVQPEYGEFRKGVLEALQKIESEGPDHGIDPDDAAEAVYALCLFMDEQVLESNWNHRQTWADEALHLGFRRDPEGGENFFHRLDELGARGSAAKEVYLACLALGFRGRYADLDPTTAAAQLADLRQRTLRSLQAAPLDKEPMLFPDGYLEAKPIAQQGPPVPKWWLGAAAAVLALALLLYIVLFVIAGRLPRDAESRLAPYTHGAPVTGAGGHR